MKKPFQFVLAAFLLLIGLLSRQRQPAAPGRSGGASLYLMRRL
ncbi:hypothetical protein [uncultured Hymenobacter sp.]